MTDLKFKQGDEVYHTRLGTFRLGYGEVLGYVDPDLKLVVVEFPGAEPWETTFHEDVLRLWENDPGLQDEDSWNL